MKLKRFQVVVVGYRCVVTNVQEPALPKQILLSEVRDSSELLDFVFKCMCALVFVYICTPGPRGPI